VVTKTDLKMLKVAITFAMSQLKDPLADSRFAAWSPKPDPAELTSQATTMMLKARPAKSSSMEVVMEMRTGSRMSRAVIASVLSQLKDPLPDSRFAAGRPKPDPAWLTSQDIITMLKARPARSSSTEVVEEMRTDLQMLRVATVSVLNQLKNLLPDSRFAACRLKPDPAELTSQATTMILKAKPARSSSTEVVEEMRTDLQMLRVVTVSVLNQLKDLPDSKFVAYMPKPDPAELTSQVTTTMLRPRPARSSSMEAAMEMRTDLLMPRAAIASVPSLRPHQ